MSQFFCSSCLLNFLQEPTYKDHYKTDFHRYNIARKMINLDPVSYEVSKEKFDKISEQKIITPIKSQTFKSINQTNQNRLSQQIEVKQEILYQIVMYVYFLMNYAIILKIVQSNHGFIIRQQKDCINIERLLKALSEQINKNNTFLHCFQTFKNSHDTKDHMLDKGHCFMPQQEYKVLSKYYNFQEKLLAILAEQKEQQLQIEAKKQQLQLKQDQKEDENKNEKKIENQDEGDWEDDEDKDINSDDDYEEELKQKQKQTDDLKNDEHIKLNQWKIISHRDYRKYYKQNHIPFKVQETEQIEKLDIADEKQFALLSDELIVGYLRHFYYQKTRTLTYGQTKIGQRNNLIQMRWLRKSC
ncbi:unnamed protein product [Paramecium pentaurelia]|uniref:C2H2-type domain-containing protein n=1 Tax=Paramecium pentaurelia TaxID=43138 RepID=A0A8S1TYN9_9CILI|nr:unnamed protein product [Paramecium pentaurelia]